MQPHLYKMIAWIIVMAMMTACGDKIEPGNTQAVPAGKVRTAIGTAAVSKQPFTYTAVGTVEARTSSTISSTLMGTIRAINVKEGSRVKKDDVLVVIDDRQVTAGFDQAQAGLAEAKRALQAAEASREEAKADAALAEATYNRYTRLYAEASVSRQEFDEVSARYKKATNGLARAEAMVAAAAHRVNRAKAATLSARISKKDVTVRAPYDGLVASKLAEVGDLASPGTPFLILEGGGGYQVKLILPEEFIKKIHSGQPLTARIPSLSDLKLNGTIETISPGADQRTRSFYVKVVMPENPSLRSGMFARVSIPVGRTDMITLPRTAVVERGQLTGFYLIDPDNTVHFRLLRIGRTLGDRIEVISGLKSGDRYVISPDPGLIDGTIVEAVS